MTDRKDRRGFRSFMGREPRALRHAADSIRRPRPPKRQSGHKILGGKPISDEQLAELTWLKCWRRPDGVSSRDANPPENIKTIGILTARILNDLITLSLLLPSCKISYELLSIVIWRYVNHVAGEKQKERIGAMRPKLRNKYLTDNEVVFRGPFHVVVSSRVEAVQLTVMPLDRQSAIAFLAEHYSNPLP